MVGLEADGAVRRIAQRGSSGDDRPARIAVDGCGAALVAGSTDGDLVGGGPGKRPDFDAFVIRFAPST